MEVVCGRLGGELVSGGFRTPHSSSFSKMVKRVKGSVSAEVPTSKRQRLKCSVSLDEPRKVAVFGTGECAQLGLGDELLERKFPMFVGRQTDMFERTPVSISAGGLHNAVIDEDGKVFTWGCNDEKALGRNGDEWTSGEVTDVISKLTVTKLTCGDSHTLALTSEGHVYVWGAYRDMSGLMGFSNNSREPCARPTRLHLPKPSRIIDIASGVNHSILLSANGDMYEWGHVRIGQRVNRRNRQRLLTPRLINLRRFGHVVKVFAGHYQSFALTKNGGVFCWGLNQYGQAGADKAVDHIHRPEEIVALKNENIVKLDGGLHHSLALSADGRVFSFGRNNYGELGLGDLEERRSPTLVPGLEGIVDIGCGSTHSLAVDEQGRAWSCGFGAMLQLGNGSEEDRLSFGLVSGKMLESYAVLACDAGAQHSLLLVCKKA